MSPSSRGRYRGSTRRTGIWLSLGGQILHGCADTFDKMTKRMSWIPQETVCSTYGKTDNVLRFALDRDARALEDLLATSAEDEFRGVRNVGSFEASLSNCKGACHIACELSGLSVGMLVKRHRSPPWLPFQFLSSSPALF